MHDVYVLLPFCEHVRVYLVELVMVGLNLIFHTVVVVNIIWLCGYNCIVSG